MRLSDEEQLDILVRRLLKHKYALDEKERFHLLALIRKGDVKIKQEEDDNDER